MRKLLTQPYITLFAAYLYTQSPFIFWSFIFVIVLLIVIMELYEI